MDSTVAALVVVGALAAATGFGLWWRGRNGRVLAVDGSAEVPAERIGADELAAAGGAIGERATLVQFSSAFCQPCRATRRILDEVAGMVDGVSHVEIDAESHLDLVRRLGVLRTPTVFVLDASGAIVKRASGLPRKADVIAALGTTV